MAAVENNNLATAARKQLFVSENSDEESTDSYIDSDNNPEWSTDGETGSSTDNDEQVDVRRSPEITPMKPTKTRKRKRNSGSWLANKARRRRNSGRAYTSTKTKKTYAGKVMGQPCSCPKKCWGRISEHAEDIFVNFWELKDFQSQNTLLVQAMKLKPKIRSYTKGRKSRRNFTFVYTVKIQGVEVEICKLMFLSIYGLQNNRGRIANLQRQLKDGRQTPKVDGRGRHGNNVRKYSDDDIQTARNFIDGIPKYQSHYSRKQNPNKVYLDTNLNISSLYTNYYKKWCSEKNKTPISSDKFRRLFCEEYNIGFKLPKSDTCPICDAYNIQIESSAIQENVDKLNSLKTDRNLHHRQAEAAQDKIKLLSAKAAENPNDIHCIAIDLQQAMPTPKLTVGPAFYKRKLWTFNLGIHDCGSNVGYMFLWTEDTAKRGSDEITSCLIKYLELVKPKSKALHIISDNCRGQNKNWTFVALYNSLVQQGCFNEIFHHFPVVGHTYLPCDRDFGRIESFTRKHPNIYNPDDWEEKIKESNKGKPFKVTRMQSEDFKDVSSLVHHITKRTVTVDKKPLQFSKASVMRCTSEHPGSLFVASSYSFCAANYFEASLKKQGRPSVDSHNVFTLARKYKNKLSIPKKKYDDIVSLMEWVPPAYQRFYNDLITDERVVDVECVDGESDEDGN